MRLEYSQNNNKFNSTITIDTIDTTTKLMKIKRRIRVIKERVQAQRVTLQYSCILKITVRKLMVFCVVWLNCFPLTNSISNNLSPETIITKQFIDYKMYCWIPFGAYTLTHNYNIPLNDTESPRILSAISLVSQEINKDNTSFSIWLLWKLSQDIAL